jgi:hypothetical protein
MAFTSNVHGELIAPAEAAALCGVAPKTLAQWRCQRIGPPYCKAGRGIRAKVLYPKAALEQWREEQLRLHEPAE